MEAIELLVTLDAREGKAADREAFLKSAQALALDEKGTLEWCAIKLWPGKFFIFDTLANEGGRNAHSTGEIAKALGVRANELLAVPPQIEKVEVLASAPLPQPTLERLGIIHGNKNSPKKEWLLNRALLALAFGVPV
jgi:hypothetical protein